MRKRSIVSSVLVIGLLAGCSSGAAPSSSSPEPVVEDMVYVAATAVPGSAHIATYAVPDALGFFEEEGIRVEENFADGSTASLQALASGSGDTTNSGMISVMSGSTKGLPVVGIASAAGVFPYRFAVPTASKIKDIKDLGGTRIGVISLASESLAFAKVALEEGGVDVASVSFIPIGAGGAPAVAALNNNEVDVLSLYGEAYVRLENEGLKLRYLKNPKLFDGVPGFGLTSTRTNLADRPDVLGRYARAVFKALVFVAVNPEAATEIGYEYYPERRPEPGKYDAQLAADSRVIATWVLGAIPEDRKKWPAKFGELTDEAFETVVRIGQVGGFIVGDVDIDAVWTNQFSAVINDFDWAEIEELATNWTPNK